MSSEAKQEWLEVWVVFSGHGHALGCYSSRTEAERHAKSFARLKPLAEACTYCRYVPATEQACAVPASELEGALAFLAADADLFDLWTEDDGIHAEMPYGLHGVVAPTAAQAVVHHARRRGWETAPSATPSKSEGEWVAPGEPRRPECADPNCGLSTDTAEAFRVIRDCEQYDYCHVECAMSHERDLGRQDGIAETQAEWVSVSGSVPALFPYERQFAWVDLPGREATVMQWKAHHWWGLDHRGQSVAFRMSHVSRYCPLPSPPKGPDAT